MAHSPTAHESFNELDPHGFEGHGAHATHVIVGPFTLRTVLAFLLFFTVLTVALAQLETAIMGWFDITLPWWVNVAVAMSIAVVKALMVMAYFMQLKYDNPINTVLMMFTFGALAIFLFFTGLDLFSRGAVDPIKQTQIVAGGTGNGITSKPNQPAAEGARERFLEYLTTLEFAKAYAAETHDANLARALTESVEVLRKEGRSNQATARDRLLKLVEERVGATSTAFADFKTKLSGEIPAAIQAAALAQYARIEADVAGHHAEAAHEKPNVPDPNRTMPRTGPTGALLETAAPAEGHGGHGAAHEGGNAEHGH